LGLEDLEALANVSVKALTQLFEDMAKGISKDKAFQDMRVRAVEQLREKKQIKQERKEHWEKQQVWLDEQRDALRREKAKARNETKVTLRSQLKEVRQIGQSDAAKSYDPLREAVESEQFHLEKCVENLDLLIEELEQAESILETFRDEEERLKDVEQRNELDRVLKVVQKAETAFRDASVNVTRMQHDFEELMGQCQEAHTKREHLQQLREEEYRSGALDDEDGPPPMGDDDDLPPPPLGDDDDLPPPIDSDDEDAEALARMAEEEDRLANASSLDRDALGDDAIEAPPSDSDDDSESDEAPPPPADEDPEAPKPSAESEEGATQAVSQESMAAIMAAMQEADDEDSDDEVSPEEDGANPEPSPMHPDEEEGSTPQHSQSAGDDGPEPQPDDSSKAAVPEPSVDEAKNSKPRAPTIRSKSITRRAVPQQRMDVSQLDTAEWMKARFDVTKFDPKKKFLSKKIRTWELDFFNSVFVNMSRKGRVKKSMKPGMLIQLEKNHTDLKRLRMQFYEANHPYELLFSTNFMRERFFEAASALRPTQYVWCPSLCMDGEGKTKTELFGSFNVTEKGNNKVVKGACKVNATAQPFETIQVFCGTWNMDEKKPPSDPRELRKWIQPDKYDVYAICVQQSGYPKEKDKFLSYIQSVLGQEYIALASSTLWGLQLVVLSRKKHGMKISNVNGEMKATGYMNVCGNRGAVGISLTFNETTLCFLCSHLMQNSGGDTPDSKNDNTKMRNKNYQETVSGLKLGNKTMDVFSQNQYIFWMGDFNYRVELPFSKALELAQRKDCAELLKHDQLNKERDAGRAFVGFKEGKIKFPPTYKYRKGKDEYRMSKKRTPSYCDRILYRAWPGCAVANTVYDRADVRISDHRPVYAGFKINTARPFASIFSSVENRCDIIFEEVRLVGNEKKIAKPTLSFHCNWVESIPMADKIAGKTSTPVWNAKALPIIVPSTPNREFLKIQHLVLIVRDNALKIGDGFNNWIGSGVLHLKSVVQNAPNVVDFKIPVYAHGLETGSLEGRAKVVYGDAPLVPK